MSHFEAIRITILLMTLAACWGVGLGVLAGWWCRAREFGD